MEQMCASTDDSVKIGSKIGLMNGEDLIFDVLRMNPCPQ